jgi:hypothetical protein
MTNYTINNEDFEMFTSFGGKFASKITISKPGALSFSSGSYNKHNLAKYSYMQLFYSKQMNAIAIKFLEAEEENSVKLKHREKNKGGFAHVKSFLDAYGLDKYYGKRFEPRKIEHPELGSILLMDLSEEE